MHLSSDKSNAHADGGDWGEWSMDMGPATPGTARAAILGWTHGIAHPAILSDRAAQAATTAERDATIAGLQAVMSALLDQIDDVGGYPRRQARPGRALDVAYDSALASTGGAEHG